jgi:hypothetical protein
MSEVKLVGRIKRKADSEDNLSLEIIYVTLVVYTPLLDNLSNFSIYNMAYHIGRAV